MRVLRKEIRFNLNEDILCMYLFNFLVLNAAERVKENTRLSTKETKNDRKDARILLLYPKYQKMFP